MLYFVRLFLLSVIACITSIVCSIGYIFAIGIQCENVFLFVVSMLVISIIFVAIIYALCMGFNFVGKVIAFLLIVIQIPSTSGMYPLDLMPNIFQLFSQFLPFSYASKLISESVVSTNIGNWFYNFLILLSMCLLLTFAVLILMNKKSRTIFVAHENEFTNKADIKKEISSVSKEYKLRFNNCIVVFYVISILVWLICMIIFTVCSIDIEVKLMVLIG